MGSWDVRYLSVSWVFESILGMCGNKTVSSRMDFSQNIRKYCYYVRSLFSEGKPKVGDDQGDQDEADGQDDLDTLDWLTE